jgi:hypothetical protein
MTQSQGKTNKGGEHRSSISQLRHEIDVLEEVETQGKEDQGDQNLRFELQRVPNTPFFEDKNNNNS